MNYLFKSFILILYWRQAQSLLTNCFVEYGCSIDDESIYCIFIDMSDSIPICLDDANIFKYKKISLSYNKFTYLPEKIFLGYQFSNIDLANNRIKKISNDAFKTQSILEYLDLSFNQIETINPAYFKYFTNLKELKLNNNLISLIRENSFDCLSNSLSLLDLSYNRIISIEKSGIHLLALRTLTINNNRRQFKLLEN